MNFNRLFRGGIIVLNPIISLFEKIFFRNKLFKENYSPVFIIGAPRTGSTVLYQMLTQSLDCIYITNLICTLSRNLYFAFWVSNRLFGTKSHDSFESNYGNTNSYNAPSECGRLWFRWFPREKDFVVREDMSDENFNQMKDSIHAIMNKEGKPMIVKNLHSGQRINVLKEAFPQAKFIFIKRDPFSTIQSVLMARKDLGFSEDYWWSVKPKEYEELNRSKYIDKITGQIYFLQKQIAEDLSTINKSNWVEIDYKEIDKRFDELVQKLGIRKTKEIDMDQFCFINRVKLSNQEVDMIKLAISKYDWTALNYNIEQ